MKQTSTVNWLGKMAFDIELNDHHFVIDADPKVGGENKGPRPKGLLLSSLAGCTGMAVVSILKKMKDAGCIGISFGFESANNHTLEYLNKGITVEESIKAIDICEKVGMNWSGGFMVGCPNETEEDIKKTLKFVRQIHQYTHSYLPPGAAQFLGFPVSETYFEMLNDDLVEYNWQDGELLIPGTRHISAKEVEERILEHNNVEEVAVFAVEDDLLGEAVKSVVVLKDPQVSDEKEIQDFCKQTLAVHKVPKYVEFIEMLPKTQSGKVNKILLASKDKKISRD